MTSGAPRAGRTAQQRQEYRTELRVARLEGAYEHLATRADVENLRGELRGEMSELRGEVRLLAGLVIGVQVAAVALIFTRIAG